MCYMYYVMLRLLRANTSSNLQSKAVTPILRSSNFPAEKKIRSTRFLNLLDTSPANASVNLQSKAVAQVPHTAQVPLQRASSARPSCVPDLRVREIEVSVCLRFRSSTMRFGCAWLETLATHEDLSRGVEARGESSHGQGVARIIVSSHDPR